MDAEGAYRVRMVEQVCHIEECRQQVLVRERRVLIAEQAAHEGFTRLPPIFQISCRGTTMMVSVSAHASRPCKVALINPYELGRQPFALAEPAAWLRQMGCFVACIELSQQRLDRELLAGADLVALFLGMHTATRIAMGALPRIRELAPSAHLCAYGLYAPVNAAYLRAQGVHTVLDGEPEAGLIKLVGQLNGTDKPCEEAPAKLRLIKPDRSGLPPLANYAHLKLPDGGRKVVGFTEATRGCKHLCRHCPVVPVFQGHFRAVPREVVLEDIRQQIAQGARHISFGDPDFMNGPTHALRLARELHAEFPQATFDATIKIQHLLCHAHLLPDLKRAGLLFVTSAVESVDDRVLERLDKNHTRADFVRVVKMLRELKIALSPTFIPFTPWTTLAGYIDMLALLAELELVESVASVQLGIRLLVPAGSYLLKLSDFRERLDAFDPAMLGYRWRHADPKVDELQGAVMATVEDAERRELGRAEVFDAIWRLAHAVVGRDAPRLNAGCRGGAVPALSENWYCCAEPTDQQLQHF